MPRPIQFLPVFIAGLFVATQPSLAQDESRWDLEGDVSIVSDYEYRGLSRTDGGFGVQGGLAMYEDEGLYAGILLSTLDKAFLGHEAEAEFYLGYAGMAGAYDYKVSLSMDTLHGSGNSTAYGELRGSLARDFGRVYINGGMAFTPDNREFGLGRSIYGFVDAEVPLTIKKAPPMTLQFHVGYEDFEGGLSKWDWKAGLYVEVMDFEAGLKYYGSSNDQFVGSGNRVVFSIRKYF